MHLLVTDRLACARCGPRFGLVLVADEITDRRVLRGFLGCANCRDRYPIHDGFGDLRPAPRGAIPDEALASSGDPREALKIAALLGVREGPGLVLLAGGAAGRANPLAELLPGIEVIAAHPALRSATETPGVSRVMMGAALPFLSASLRGVVLEGRAGSAQLDEGIRALAPGCRLVLLGPPEGALERMEAGELDLLMESAGVLVGARK